MILDADRNGIAIWLHEHVTRINGMPVDVCNELYRRIVVPRETNSGDIVYDQIYEIGIDIGGDGIIYKRILNDMGIKTYDIRCKNVDIILPTRMDVIPNNAGTQMLYDNIHELYKKKW